jgi:hypothetical protein
MLYDPDADDWQVVSARYPARFGHTATLLSDGRVLVAGGEGARGNVGPVTLFDPVAEEWRPGPAMAVPRRWHTSTLLPDGRVLVVGGYAEADVTDSAELFDPGTGAWARAAPLRYARQRHSATLLPDGRILVVGGDDGGPRIRGEVEIYDPDSDTWSEGARLEMPRLMHSATLLSNGSVLVVGGSDGFNSLRSTALYDPQADEWSPGDDLAEPRFDHSATLLADGKVMVAGGWDSHGIEEGWLDSVEVYDPAGGRWRDLGMLGSKRVGHRAALLLDGRVLLTGGYNEGGSLASAEIFSDQPDHRPEWGPQLDGPDGPVWLGSPLVVTGDRLGGLSEGSGGNGSQHAGANHPLVRLRSMAGGATLFALPDPNNNKRTI